MSIKSGYKQTEIGIIPENWEVVQQSEVATFYNGRAYKLSEWEEVGTPVIRLQNLTGTGTDYYYSTLRLPEHQYCINGDLLYMWSATFGPVWWKGEKAIYHYHIWKIITEKNKLDRNFLFYLLDQITIRMKKQSHGSTMIHVTKGGMEKLKIQLPPLEEQNKIADILSTVDKKIAFVEENINATEELKKGLMQKLLTEGIGHTEFKDSELGRIPESWEIKKLPEITTKITSGGTPSRAKPQYYENGTVNWIKTGELRDCYIYDSAEKITEEAVTNSSAKKFPVDTLLIAMYGATIGRTAYLKVESSTNQACCALIFNPEKANTHFYWQYFLFIKEILISKGCGAGQPNISQGIIKDLSIPFPPLEEQKQIAEILSTVDKKIENLKEKKQSFEELKKGLMQKLLTGEVRV